MPLPIFETRHQILLVDEMDEAELFGRHDLIDFK
jgi:hypothetical protein